MSIIIAYNIGLVAILSCIQTIISGRGGDNIVHIGDNITGIGDHNCSAYGFRSLRLPYIGTQRSCYTGYDQTKVGARKGIV